LAAGKRRICRAKGSSGESASRLSVVRGRARDGIGRDRCMPQSARGAPAKSLLPSRSCQIDEVVVGQAAAAVADRAPNRHRPSDAPPFRRAIRTTRRCQMLKCSAPIWDIRAGTVRWPAGASRFSRLSRLTRHRRFSLPTRSSQSPGCIVSRIGS